MNQMGRVIVGLFAAAWGVALFILAVGTWGLFGQERDPLAGVFLLPLGLPWNIVLDDMVPTAALPWLGVLAPGINLAILWTGCRLYARRRGTAGA